LPRATNLAGDSRHFTLLGVVERQRGTRALDGGPRRHRWPASTDGTCEYSPVRRGKNLCDKGPTVHGHQRGWRLRGPIMLRREDFVYAIPEVFLMNSRARCCARDHRLSRSLRLSGLKAGAAAWAFNEFSARRRMWRSRWRGLACRSLCVHAARVIENWRGVGAAVDGRNAR